MEKRRNVEVKKMAEKADKSEKKEKISGITLIALVITIIVLLILVGVSLSTLTGQDGILNKAATAADKTNKMTAEEAVQVEVLGSYNSKGELDLGSLNENLINNLRGIKYNEKELSKENKISRLPAVVEYNGYSIMIAEDEIASLPNIVQAGEKVTKTEKYNYTDGENFATIPEGFKVSEKKEEQKIENGLVIKDDNGNEFVWIPCEYSSSTNNSTDTVYYNDITIEGSSKDNRNNDWRKFQYLYNGGTWYDEQPHTIGKKSIEKYHGFYVARYEAGVPENANFYVSEKSTGEELIYKDGSYKNYTTTNGVDENKQDVRTLAPVSKKGQQAWSCISQINAKKVAENMVKTSNVQSYLIDSHAWNTICRLIAQKDKSRNLEKPKTWGNYSDNITTEYEKLQGLYALHSKSPWKKADKYNTGTISKGTNINFLELATGICEDFKAYNIYDLAGNMWEWTTETGIAPKEDNITSNATCNESECPVETEDLHAVARGGCSCDNGDEKAVFWAAGDALANRSSAFHVGFRVVLYLI